MKKRGYTDWGNKFSLTGERVSVNVGNGGKYSNQLRALPLANVISIVRNVDLNKYKTIEEFMQELHNGGFMKMIPYVAWFEEPGLYLPVLVIKPTAFMQFNLAGTFDVTYTADGNILLATSMFNFNSLLGNVDVCKACKDFVFLSIASSVISIGSKYIDSCGAMFADESILTVFIKDTIRNFSFSLDGDLDSLLKKYFRITAGGVDYHRNAVYEICDEANNAYLRFTISKKRIEVEYPVQGDSHRLIAIDIPFFPFYWYRNEAGVCMDLQKEEQLLNCIFKDCLISILHMCLTIAGATVDFKGCSRRLIKGNLTRIGTQNIIRINSLEDIINIELK